MKRIYLLLLLGFFSAGGFGQITAPTRGEIYDFAVGDTFLYTQTPMGPGGTNLYFMNVILTATKSIDSFAYTYKRINAGYDRKVYSESTAGFSFAWLDSAYYYLKFNADSITLSTAGGDSVFRAYGSANGTCYNSGSPYSCVVNYELDARKGFGITRDYFSKQDAAQLTYLSYAHKSNGEMHGIPEYFVTGLEHIEQQHILTISPNPAISAFQLSFANPFQQEAHLQVFDAVGRIVKQELLINPHTTLDRGSLNDGVYFWQVSSGERILDRGKLVLQ